MLRVTLRNSQPLLVHIFNSHVEIHVVWRKWDCSDMTTVVISCVTKRFMFQNVHRDLAHTKTSANSDVSVYDVEECFVDSSRTLLCVAASHHFTPYIISHEFAERA